jgi:hypothetical protein
MSKTTLKIKGLTLAAEARIIKKIEKNRRRNPEQRKSLYLHRTNEVRSEARSTHLAFGFLRGRTMQQMERPLRPLDQGHVRTKNMTRTAPDWKRIETLVSVHGGEYFDNPQALAQRFAEFKDGGAPVNVA